MPQCSRVAHSMNRAATLLCAPVAASIAALIGDVNAWISTPVFAVNCAHVGLVPGPQEEVMPGDRVQVVESHLNLPMIRW